MKHTGLSEGGVLHTEVNDLKTCCTSLENELNSVKAQLAKVSAGPSCKAHIRVATGVLTVS